MKSPKPQNILRNHLSANNFLHTMHSFKKSYAFLLFNSLTAKNLPAKLYSKGISSSEVFPIPPSFREAVSGMAGFSRYIELRPRGVDVFSDACHVMDSLNKRMSLQAIVPVKNGNSHGLKLILYFIIILENFLLPKIAKHKI